MNKPPKLIYINPQEKVEIHPIKEIKYLERINQRNKEVKSIIINEMPIKVRQKNGLTINAKAFIAMEKDKNFRLIVNHRFTGKEIDIGSNDKYFWFWSKRMVPQALYYAKYEDINQTRLKTVFNPVWMMESLNFNIIDNNYELGKLRNYYALTQVRKNIYNESVKIMILIDPKKEVILGRYLYQNDKLLISTEYESFIDGFARKITINWFEESIFMEWNLEDIKFNTKINPTTWKLPDINNKINMAE